MNWAYNKVCPIGNINWAYNKVCPIDNMNWAYNKVCPIDNMNWTYNKVCPIDNMYSAYNSKSRLKAKQNKANSKRIYLLSLQYQCLSLFSHLPWTASQSMVALHSPGNKTQLQFLFSYMTTWLIEYEPLPHCILSMFSTRTC